MPSQARRDEQADFSARYESATRRYFDRLCPGQLIPDYAPLYPCINPSDDPIVSEDLIRAELNRVMERQHLSANPDAKQKKARALASIGGYFPPYMIREYAKWRFWSRYTGLTLLAGFRPEILAGVSLTQLAQLQGEKVLDERLTTSLCFKEIIPYGRLYRLDGVFGVDLASNKHTNPNLHGFEISRDDGIGLCLNLLLQFCQARDRIMPCWSSSTLRDEEELKPYKFVKWAIDNEIHIPWLVFSHRHYPRLLPKKKRGPNGMFIPPLNIYEQEDAPKDLRAYLKKQFGYIPSEYLPKLKDVPIENLTQELRDFLKRYYPHYLPEEIRTSKAIADVTIEPLPPEDSEKVNDTTFDTEEKTEIEKRNEKWQEECDRLHEKHKHNHPKKSRKWIAEQIAKMPVGEGRNWNTIYKEIKFRKS